MPHAAAMVCHGGFGTRARAGSSAGVPMAVLPLFADQPYNARRVARARRRDRARRRPGGVIRAGGRGARAARPTPATPRERRRVADESARCRRSTSPPRSCASSRRADARGTPLRAGGAFAAHDALSPTGPGVRRAARSPRSPTTASCRTARRPRWSRPTATSSGCACRGWTRRACSARCSTATPATSGSARPGVQGARRAALPAGHDGAGDELGHARRLGDRARRAADRVRGTTPTTARTRTGARRPTTTPTTCCCAPSGASTARSSSGSRASPRSTTAPSARPGSTPATATTCAVARAEGSDVELRLTTDLNLGIEGPRVTARHLIKEGETLFCALSWSEHPAPRQLRGGVRPARLDRAPLAALARPRRVPRPPVARRPAALRADAQGPHLRADRRDRRRRDDVAARDARRRAQLGLPLLVDPRLDVRALGPLHARLRLGGERLLLLRRRRGARPSAGRCRSCTGSTGAPSCPSARSTTSRATRTRGRCASATPRTRRPSTTSGARCSTPSTCTRSRATRCPSASGRC